MKPAAALLILCLSGGLLFAQESDDLLRRSLSLVNAERPADAEHALRVLLERQPGHVVARSLLGFLLVQRSRLEEAEDAFRAALGVDPGNGTARFGLGLVLARRGLPERAAREFERVLSDESVGWKARLHWIDTLFLAGDDEQAFRQALEACERFPMVADFHAMAAKLHQARGDADRALRSYIRAIEIEPLNPRYYRNAVEIFRSQKEFPSALHWADRGLEVDRDSPVLREEKAAVLDRLGRIGEARTERDEARRTRNAEIAYARAMGALRGGDSPLAKRFLEESVRLNPLLSKAWTELAEILRGEGSYDEALRAYLMAVEGDPENGRARVGTALTLRAQGKTAEALTSLQRAIGRGMESPDLLAGLAAAYLEQGRAEEAAAALSRALRQVPDDPDLLSYLGYLEESRTNRQAAQEAYARAIKIDPEQFEALLARARYLIADGETAEGIRTLRVLNKRHPDRVEAWHALTDAYVRTGNPRAAEPACRACLARFPNDRDCLEQLAYIKIAQGDFRAAAGHFETMCRNGVTTRSTLNGLAFSLVQAGEYARATRLLEDSLKRYGPDVFVYANLGYVQRCLGKIAAAVDSYRRSRDLAPTDPARHRDLGFALYLSRDYRAAEKSLQAALRLQPDWGAAHYDLAMNYWRMGQHKLALAHARVAQQKNVPQATRVVAALSPKQAKRGAQ